MMTRPTVMERSQTPEIPTVINKLQLWFGGCGLTNGVGAILTHPELPEVFGEDYWSDWTFKPSEGAFIVAASLGLIEPQGNALWSFTPLGLETQAWAKAYWDDQK